MKLIRGAIVGAAILLALAVPRANAADTGDTAVPKRGGTLIFAVESEPVSYTHLTLPTILRV